MARGLLFVASVVDLSVPWARLAFCGDSSDYGYALAVAKGSVDKVKHEAGYLEKALPARGA